MSLDEIISKAGGAAKLAQIAGVQRATVSVTWRRIGHIPVNRARRVSEALGIPLHEMRPDVWAPGERVA